MHDRPDPGLPVYLLAGGQSRRFGSDKARAALDGTPLIVRLARQLKPVVASLTVIGRRAGQYSDLELDTISDIHPGMGPMAGLHTALHHVAQPWLLLCSCDLLECPAHWLTALAASRTTSTQAVVFQDQQWHPFPGLYHRSLLTQVERRITLGDLRMQELLDDVAMPIALPNDWPAVAQVNTPDDLALAGHNRQRNA